MRLLLTALVAFCLCLTGEAAITRISSAAAQTTGVNITTPTSGDLILVFAHRDGNTTAPTLATGYTNIHFAGANTTSARLAYKYSNGTETNIGTWTNATSVAVGVYRGVDSQYPIGGWAVGGSSSTSIAYNTFTLWAQNSTSWVVGFGAHRTATNVTTAPTLMTARSNATDILISDTNGAVSSWATTSTTVNANSGWRSYTVELRVAPTSDSPPSTDLLVQHVNGPSVGGGRTCTSIATTLPNLTKAGNTVVVSTLAYDGVTVTVTDDVSNTYTSRATFDDTVSSNMKLWVFVADNVTAGARVITTHYPAEPGISGQSVQVAEFYGCNNASFDVSNATTVNNATPLPLQAGSITTTQTNDLIYQVAFSIQGPSTTQPNLSRIAKDANMTLLAADLLDGSMAQYGIKATAGAFNPAFYTNPTGKSGQVDLYFVATIALKTDATKGQAGSGKRIIRTQSTNYFLRTGPAINLQFPCSGGLVVMGWSGFDANTQTPVNLNSVADNAGNTWASTGSPAINALSASIFYAKNVTAFSGLAMQLTCASAQEQSNGILYDMAGMDATSPFDVDATATGLQNTPGNLTTVTITPTNSDGIVICSGNQDLGTLSGLVGSGYIADMQVYPEADGAKVFWQDGGQGHYNNSSTSALTFVWTEQGSSVVAAGVDTWAFRAAAFKATASSANTNNFFRFFSR